MSITKRADRGTFRVSVTINGKRIRPSFPTKREAEQFLRDHRLKKMGLIREVEAVLLVEAFTNYFETESISKTRVSRTNDRRYLNLAYHFLSVERGIKVLDDIELQDLKLLQRWLAAEQRFGDEIKEAWSPSTVNRCFHTLKHLFTCARREGRLKSNPGEFLSPLGENESARRAMTLEEFERTVDAAPDWYVPTLKFLWLTGARPSSIARLNWGDVDFVNERAHLISKKGAKARAKTIIIPLRGETFRVLMRLKNDRPFAKLSEPVFRCESDGRLSAEWISKVGNRAIRRAGLKGVVLYGIRHSLATDLTEAGVPTELVRQALGHANIRTTQTYARGAGLDAVADALARVRGKVRAPTGPEK